MTDKEKLINLLNEFGIDYGLFNPNSIGIAKLIENPPHQQQSRTTYFHFDKDGKFENNFMNFEKEI